MAQGQGQGQGRAVARAPRQQQRQPDRIDYEKASREVLGGLDHYRDQLEPVLPAGMTWARFHATIATLLHHNPSILKCTVPSIIRGCMKAAYDGLALDGREAALVPSKNKYGKSPNQVERLEARYNPMVAGLRKQILQSGLVDAVEVILVYEGEPYRVIRGTQKRVEHEEIIDCRGPGKKIIAVYAVAEMKNGRQIVETMTRAEVEQVRAMAQTDNVWKAWEGEMYRKTCLRRIRKQLPGIGDVRDAEMLILFPEMSRGSAPVPAAGAALPAPPRPTRGDFQSALEAPAATMDEFNRFDRAVDETFEGAEGELVAGSAAQPGPKKEASAQPAAEEGAGGSEGSEGSSEGSPAATSGPKIPASPDEWDLWADEMRSAVGDLKDVDAVNAEFERQGPVIAKAPKRLADAVSALFTDRLAEIASDPPSGASATSQGGLNLAVDGDPR